MLGNAIHSERENRRIKFEREGSNELSFTSVDCYIQMEKFQKLDMLFGVQECSVGCRYSFENHLV